MVKKIRLMLEYNTYCLWLYNENNEIVDNNNPTEWEDNQELTEAFMAVSDLYDSFYINTAEEFRYVGCPDEETREELKQLIEKAISILLKLNNGKYEIVDDIDYSF